LQTSNIDKFDLITGHIFTSLYSEFPSPKDLNIVDFTNESLPNYYVSSNIFHGVIIEDDAKTINDTIGWLIHEDYIRAKLQTNTGFKGCVLTSKGLAALKSIPDSLRPSKTLGDTLKDTMEKATTDVSKDTIKNIISSIISYGTSLLQN
jgi:hypothetical protein